MKDSGPKEQTHLEEGPTKTTGTQSDYREMDVQTDPFTPDYVVKDGETPEVKLSLYYII